MSSSSVWPARPPPAIRCGGGGSGSVEVGRGGQVAQDGRGGGNLRGDQVGTAALALPPLEVAVGGGGAALARLQGVRVHAQTHGAAGEAPLGTGGREDLVQPLQLRLCAHRGRAWYHQHAYAVSDLT